MSYLPLSYQLVYAPLGAIVILLFTYAFRLLERLGTDPQVWYLSKREWVRREGDNYLENEKTGENKRQG